MRFGQIRIQLRRFARGFVGARREFDGRQDARRNQAAVRDRHFGVGRGAVRVGDDGLLEVFNCASAIFDAALVALEAAFQQQVVGYRVHALALRDLLRLRAAQQPTDVLEAAAWHKISGPLSAVLMPLLGAVAAFGLARSGRLFVRAVIGMALGFAFFVADNFMLAMGNFGTVPPLMAAWAPFLLFLLIGEAVLIRTEE